MGRMPGLRLPIISSVGWLIGLMGGSLLIALRVGCLPSHRLLALRLKGLLWLSVCLKLGVLLAFAPRHALEWALALWVGFALVMAEFGWLFWRLYPLERAQRGLALTRGEYLHLRLRLVFEQLAPLMVVGLVGLPVTTLLQGVVTESPLEGLLLGLTGVVGIAIAVLYVRWGLPLPVRALSVGAHLQAEVQRMGRELGVPVRELLVLDGSRARIAGAFALSGGRIAITDYLLANLTEREALAVLAHEVAHLAQRRRLWRLWLLQTGAAVGLMLGTAPLWQAYACWLNLTLLALLLVGMAAPMLWLRQRHELQADTFAVSQYGADAMQSALLKVAMLRGKPPEKSLHPGLQRRLRALNRFALR